ncbi:uncharacterized protein [Nicotiana sylvestris]|uniref:uncharacterized protein n=1 Tax=Nicotiana sylvestris TaxID=4096 RepID=UPI00388CE117
MSVDALWRLDRFTKLFTTAYGSISLEDPQDYLDSCHEVLRNMGIMETNGVNFVAFRLSGSAKTWWRDYCLARPAGSPSLTWDQFSQLFLEKYFLITQRKDYRRPFERLQQGSMTITKYDTRFIALPCHALIILPTERERVMRFIEGLAQPIRLQMAKETGSEITFQDAANVARRDEMNLFQGSGQGSDKRPCHSGRFNGASSGGRDSFGRGHPPRLFHLAIQAFHGAPGGRGSYMQYSDQQFYSAPPAPISAPSLQSFQGGYPGRQGQFQGQQSQQQRACYTCGDTKHIARFCPRTSSSS